MFWWNTFRYVKVLSSFFDQYLLNPSVQQNVISGWNKCNVNNILLLELASALTPSAVVTSLGFFKCPLLQF